MKLKQFIAGNFGIVGFVLALIAGLRADNAFESIVNRALLSAVICYAVGYCIGVVVELIAKEHAKNIADKVAAVDEAHDAEEEALHTQELIDEAEAQDAAAAGTTSNTAAVGR